MIPSVPGSLPRRGGLVTRAIGRAILGALGWRIEGVLPNVKQLVIIAAPHTTNWDFLVGLGAKWALALDAAWLGKDSLFKPPFGALFRHWGGIPVDRSTSNDVVSQVVKLFGERESFALALAPEGTRSAAGQWRSGFWHIAIGARVPIMPIAFDWEHKVLRIWPAVPTSGDVEADLSRLRGMYGSIRGKA